MFIRLSYFHIYLYNHWQLCDPGRVAGQFGQLCVCVCVCVTVGKITFEWNDLWPTFDLDIWQDGSALCVGWPVTIRRIFVVWNCRLLLITACGLDSKKSVTKVSKREVDRSLHMSYNKIKYVFYIYLQLMALCTATCRVLHGSLPTERTPLISVLKKNINLFLYIHTHKSRSLDRFEWNAMFEFYQGWDRWPPYEIMNKPPGIYSIILTHAIKKHCIFWK